MPLKLINGLSTATVTPNGFYNEIAADLKVPGNPLLMAFCCDPVTVALRQKRQQTVMLHGNKLWFPCVPLIYVPISHSGSRYNWSIARCQCGIGKTATYIIGEFGAPPILQWHSLPHQAISCNAAQVIAAGLGQFAPIPYPPGGPLTGAGSQRDYPLDWEATGCAVALPGHIRVDFNGVVLGSPLGPHSTKITMQVTRDTTVLFNNEYETEEWPAEKPTAFTTDDDWNGTGLGLYRVTAGYDPSRGLGGARGTLTFTWLPP